MILFGGVQIPVEQIQVPERDPQDLRCASSSAYKEAHQRPPRIPSGLPVYRLMNNRGDLMSFYPRYYDISALIPNSLSLWIRLL